MAWFRRVLPSLALAALTAACVGISGASDLPSPSDSHSRSSLAAPSETAAELPSSVATPQREATMSTPPESRSPSLVACSYRSDALHIFVKGQPDMEVRATIALDGDEVLPANAVAVTRLRSERSYVVAFLMDGTDPPQPFAPTVVEGAIESATGRTVVPIALNGTEGELRLPDDLAGQARLIIDVTLGDGDCIAGRARATFEVDLIAS